MADTDVEPVLRWDEIVDLCSRLHTTRRRPGYVPGETREGSRMVDVLIGWNPARPAQIVPTRMHEPGFYWRWMDEGESGIRRDDAGLEELRQLVDAGQVRMADDQ